uniref:Secreted protein n=1 Tax=Macrostomum lignano TaxID=282301 RepID=A0A1I8IE25_9PLAT
QASRCNLTRRRNVTLTCSSSADPAPGLAWRLLLPLAIGGQQTAQELRSQSASAKTASPRTISPFCCRVLTRGEGPAEGKADRVPDEIVGAASGLGDKVAWIPIAFLATLIRIV